MQMPSYLALSGIKVGLLVDFKVRVLKDGIQRMVLDLDEQFLPVPLPFSAFSASSAVRS